MVWGFGALDFDKPVIPDQSVRRSAKERDFGVEPEACLGDKSPGVGFVCGAGDGFHFGSPLHIGVDIGFFNGLRFSFCYELPQIVLISRRCFSGADVIRS
jgi:hypothetical protein